MSSTAFSGTHTAINGVAALILSVILESYRFLHRSQVERDDVLLSQQFDSTAPLRRRRGTPWPICTERIIMNRTSSLSPRTARTAAPIPRASNAIVPHPCSLPSATPRRPVQISPPPVLPGEPERLHGSVLHITLR